MPESATELRNDPRWRRLQERPWVCPSCDEPHHGLFDIAYPRPHAWEGCPDYSPNATVESSSNFLSQDFCVIDNTDFFVRCVLELPIIGGDGERFGFGVWSSLSRSNFEVYVETFQGDEQGSLGPWFGWLSNRLRGYDETLNLRCSVQPRDGRQRPLIELEPSDHLLARDQRVGLTFERLLDIYAALGHDLRGAL